MTSRRRRLFLAIAILAPFLIPPLEFVVVGLNEGMPPAEPRPVVDQYGKRGFNPAMAGLLGLLPVGLLLLVVWIYRKIGGRTEANPAIAPGDPLPLLAFLAWINFELWPTYLPDKTFPGFPHGLERGE